MRGVSIQMRNPKCWANSLGNCSKKLSREHLITEKIFGPRSPIGVSNTKYRLSGPINRRSLTTKVLCTTHNASLSIADDEALRLFSALRTIHSHSKDGQLEASEEYRFDSGLLERWLLKTLVNFVACDAFEWASPIRRGSDVVDQRYVQVAFGFRRFTDHAGTYLIERVENLNNWGEHFNVTPLTTEKGTVGGLVLRFCSLWFLLWTTAHVPIHPSVFKTEHVNGFRLHKLPSSFTVSTGERQHHVLKFL
jgi:hypothetical protein